MDGIAQGLPAPATDATDEVPAPAKRTATDAAFAALVDRNARFLFRVAFGLLGNHQDAEDAVQDTLLKLYRLDAWQMMDDEKAFLARAVWRAGLDRLATAGARAMKNSRDVTEFEVASTAATPEEHALSDSERRTMRLLIAGLPESLRQALVLSAVEGMKSREVAAVLGIPEGTVRTRILRAKEELRRRFLAMQPKLKSRMQPGLAAEMAPVVAEVPR